MTGKTRWESFKAEGANVIDRLNNLIREGNVRRVIVEHKGKTVAEFPLTVGVVGAVIAPVAALVGVLVAILQDCTIKVEREVNFSDRPSAAPEVIEVK
jgi:GTPase